MIKLLIHIDPKLLTTTAKFYSLSTLTLYVFTFTLKEAVLKIQAEINKTHTLSIVPTTTHIRILHNTKIFVKNLTLIVFVNLFSVGSETHFVK